MDAKDFVDFAGFYLTLAAVDELLEAGADPATAPAGVTYEELQQHRARAEMMLRSVAHSMDDGINVLLRQMAEKAPLRVKVAIDTALTGNPVTGYRKRAKLLALVFDRLAIKATAVRDVLDEAATKGLLVMRAASQSTPAGRIAAVANVSSASGTNTRMKKWSMVASNLTGNPVKDEDVLANDLTEAKELVKLGQVTDLKISARDPGDADMPELAEKKALTDQALTTAINQSVNPQAVQTAVAMAKQEAAQHPCVTLVGKAIEHGLTAPQEECVMARGKLVIAAGAGAGKTKVLAAKVIYHVQELKVPVVNVMAVSFSVKSAAELKVRVRKFGKAVGIPLDESSQPKILQGMGTTHSVARMVLNQSHRFRVSGSQYAPESEQPVGGELMNKLLRAAIAQVKMKPATQVTTIPADALSFFPLLGTKNFSALKPLTEVKQPITQPAQAAPALSYYLEDPSRFAKLVDTTVTALTNAAMSLSVRGLPRKTQYGPRTLVSVTGPGLDQFASGLSAFKVENQYGRREAANPQYRTPDQFIWWASASLDVEAVKRTLFAALGLDTVTNSLMAVQLMGKDPTKLTDQQKVLLQEIVTQPVVASSLAANNMGVQRTAADKTISLESYENRKDEKEAKSDISDFAFYLNNPVNMWFNLGATDKDFEVSDGKGKGGTKKVSPGAFKRYISLSKNNLNAPGKLYLDQTGTQGQGMVSDEDDADNVGVGSTPAERILAAVYGAYEWLKTNSPKTKGRLDYDDQLIQAVRVLTEDPGLLAKFQMQYRVVLVDEAQDLNPVQHNLFGLIAGYINPTTLTPRADGKTTADTYAFIGDDKQAIYEFRGANPDKFIEKSDTFEVTDEAGNKKKGDFKTILLDKNFRSGKAIVDAANKLISYNEKQIPMVCTTDPRKGEGSILRDQIGFDDEGPDLVVRRIESDIADIKADDGVVPKGFYKQYGLATRTNRELQQYQMALIGAGIPFRSKRNPFEGPALGPVVGLMKMFLPSATVDVRNKGFLLGLKTPDVGVSPKTVGDRLKAMNAGDYYEYCKNGGYKDVYADRGYTKTYLEALKTYCTKYVPDLEELVTKGTSKEFLDFITSSTGVDGQSFIDQLAVSIRNSPDDLEEAQALADQDDGDGIITDAILRQQAAKPLEPLYKLADKYPTPLDFVGYMNSLATKSVQVMKTDDEAEEDADLVTLDTVHGWKGLECDHLFVPMAQGRFPIVRPDAKDAQRAMESERRLAYVAITRGRNSVTIIEPTMRMKGDKVVAVPPSQFATEACVQVKGKVDTSPQTPPDGSDGSNPYGVDMTEADPDGAGKTASVNEAMRTGALAPFLMPVFEHNTRTAAEEHLTAQWGNFLTAFEGN